MARFAEKFSDFAFLMKELYGDFAEEAILHSKENFLKDIAKRCPIADNVTLTTVVRSVVIEKVMTEN